VYRSRRKTELEGGKLEPQTRPKPDGGTSTESPRRVLIVNLLSAFAVAVCEES